MEATEPKERQNNDEQMYAAFTFAFILIVVGMPLWWHTTQVYRVALPYSEMDSLRPETSPLISTRIQVAAIDAARTKYLADAFKLHFSNSSIFNVSVTIGNLPNNLKNKKKLLEVESAIHRPAGAILLAELDSDLPIFKDNSAVLGQNSTIFFSKKAGPEKILSLLEKHVLQEIELTTRLLRTWTQRTPSSKHFAPEPAYDVLVTVIHPTPGTSMVNFDVVKNIQEYIGPFVDGLHGVMDLHVKSQWLHLVDLRPNPPPQRSSDDTYFALSQSALPHLITPLEKKLGSHVSARPVINLVVWITPCETAPMHIETADGQQLKSDAFISPRWGGIQIVNPNPGSCDVDVDGRQVMTVFVEQLRVLLGLPSAAVLSGHVIPTTVPLLKWEKDALIRRRTLEFVSSAKHTLKSLSELLGKISNIVINDKVGNNIFDALENVHACESALSEGDLKSAHNAAVAAHIAAETAFTDPSLLALLYFPEDQKYAVYIPLFLPVMIPVLISFKPMREWFSAKMSSRKAKVE